MKKIYVSIPISGEDYNEQRSRARAVAFNLMQKSDCAATTPFDLAPCDTPYNEAMGRCVASLLDCDAIYLCKGWQESRGCRAELQVALVYGKEVMSE